MIFIGLVLNSCETEEKFNYQNSILVCGGSKVLIVKNTNTDSSEVIWSWEPKDSNELPFDYKTKKFTHMADCKSVNNGKQLLICSSSGGVALVNIHDKKTLFYADVPNAHSIEMLPNNKVVAAASTNLKGNRLMVFDINSSENLLFSDELYSAHGVVWDKKQNSLFALGYDVLREYKIVDEIKLVLKQEWKIPGISGHDLQMAPDGNKLYLTESTGAWIFDLQKNEFSKIRNFPDAKNIKSINENTKGQFVYTVPEESWWTYHVSLHNPSGKIPFPNLRVYKARWFEH